MEEYNTLMLVHHQGSINSFIMCVDSLIEKCHQNNFGEKKVTDRHCLNNQMC